MSPTSPRPLRALNSWGDYVRRSRVSNMSVFSFCSQVLHIPSIAISLVILSVVCSFAFSLLVLTMGKVNPSVILLVTLFMELVIYNVVVCCIICSLSPLGVFCLVTKWSEVPGCVAASVCCQVFSIGDAFVWYFGVGICCFRCTLECCVIFPAGGFSTPSFGVGRVPCERWGVFIIPGVLTYGLLVYGVWQMLLKGRFRTSAWLTYLGLSGHFCGVYGWPEIDWSWLCCHSSPGLGVFGPRQ